MHSVRGPVAAGLLSGPAPTAPPCLAAPHQPVRGTLTLTLASPSVSICRADEALGGRAADYSRMDAGRGRGEPGTLPDSRVRARVGRGCGCRKSLQLAWAGRSWRPHTQPRPSRTPHASLASASPPAQGVGSSRSRLPRATRRRGGPQHRSRRVDGGTGSGWPRAQRLSEGHRLPPPPRRPQSRGP